ncbi:MAG: PLD nuclease N-terminal domain-containing protein [Pseudomonas sp.]
MGSTLYSLLTLVIFALDIWAIINVVRSQADTLKKVLWVALIAFLPVLGLIIWAVAGPRGNVRL